MIVEVEKLPGLYLVVGVYHKNYPKDCIRKENAKVWAKWLASRYKDSKCIIWSMYPEATKEYIPISRELGEGLKQGSQGAHLVTLHPDPSPTGSGDLFHNEE